MKPCRRCGAELPPEMYAHSGYRKDGTLRRRTVCKGCVRIYNKKQYELNQEARIAYQKDWYAQNREEARRRARERYWDDVDNQRALMRDRNRAAKYGFSLGEFAERWAAQGERCAACARPTERPQVDHDHNCCPGEYTCGKCVRDILCGDCNVALGILKDSAERVAMLLRYLEKWA